ncbi:hypothetical protein DID88_006306 [Monilinia fructigena]|uniref:Uncharacterized protein n=1 Tax=Monilinia fructigena TaxID=38457 RepID=A0A395J2Y8_9HELO|nr:hypothetical protein DID88_006306 [Monilinia fructigena]
MLSTTFSTIVSNATAEIQFRRGCPHPRRCKIRFVIRLLSPFNILALFVLMPLKFVLTPRWFHKINVAAVRFLNAPLLLLIGYLERRQLWAGHRRQKEAEQLPRAPPRPRLWDFSRGFSVHGDLQAVFDTEPPSDIEDEIERTAENDIPRDRNIFEQDFVREFNNPASTKANSESLQNAQKNLREDMKRRDTINSSKRIRRDSVAPFAGMSIPKHLRDLLNEGSSDEEGGIFAEIGKVGGVYRRVERLLELASEEGGGDGTLSDLDRSVAVEFSDD